MSVGDVSFALMIVLLTIPAWVRLGRNGRLGTPLGAVNFLVLQWFGVRLAASFEPRHIPGWTSERITDEQIVALGGRWWSRYAPPRGVRVRWIWLRWIWPLTGWWSDFRWIARRS